MTSLFPFTYLIFLFNLESGSHLLLHPHSGNKTESQRGAVSCLGHTDHGLNLWCVLNILGQEIIT